MKNDQFCHLDDVTCLSLGDVTFIDDDLVVGLTFEFHIGSSY